MTFSASFITLAASLESLFSVIDIYEWIDEGPEAG